MIEKTEHIWKLIARKFSGDATFEELEELELLLVQNPLENYSMEILNDLWHSGSPTNELYAENKYKELVLRMQKMGIDEGKFTDTDELTISREVVKNKSSKKWMVGITSFIITGLIIFFLLNNKASDNTAPQEPLAKHEIKTKYGSKTSLVLPDGTKVWLNAGSKMTYSKHYGADLREVNLTGEAYFDVVKNADKPFIIHAGNIKIKVLGTAFNVRSYPDEKSTETSLVRGSLEITTNGSREKYILKPYQKLIVSNKPALAAKEDNAKNLADADEPKTDIELGRLSVMEQDSSIVETAWVYNRLVFNGETFEEVAHKMERWYAVSFVIKDDKLKTKKFTGIFENETVDQALEALQLTTRFMVNYKNGQIIISK